MSFSENLMRLRKQKGLSQEEFANEIDVSRQTVSKWELGSSTPEMDKLVKMAEFFNVSVDELLQMEDITSKTNTESDAANNNNLNNYNNYNSEPTSNTSKKKNVLTVLFVTLLIGAIITIITILIILLVRELDGKKDNKPEDKNIVNTAANVTNIVENKSENIVENQAKNVIENKVENTVENKISPNTNTVNTTNTEKIEKNQKSVDASRFNLYYHRGTWSGFHIGYALEDIITSNYENPDKQIFVKYNNIESNEKEVIKSIKNKLGTYTNYDVEFEYDEDGYINKYIIEEE